MCFNYWMFTIIWIGVRAYKCIEVGVRGYGSGVIMAIYLG